MLCCHLNDKIPWRKHTGIFHRWIVRYLMHKFKMNMLVYHVFVLSIVFPQKNATCSSLEIRTFGRKSQKIESGSQKVSDYL